MSRILLVTLAVLCLVLAIVFSKTIFYALATLLCGVALVSYLYERRNEFLPRKSGIDLKIEPSTTEDLSSFGILEIKPVEKSAGKKSATKTADQKSSVRSPESNSSSKSNEGKLKDRSMSADAGPEPRSEKFKESSPQERTKGNEELVHRADLFDSDEASRSEFNRGEDVSVARPVARKEKKPSKPGKDAESNQAGRPARHAPSKEIKAKPRADEDYIAVQEADEENLAKVLVPCLVSLRAAINAHTVCVLSYKLDTTKYSIVGVVSKNGYARTSGSFISPVPLFSSTKSRNTVEVLRVGPDGLLEDAVGYYRENISVRSVATARIYTSGDSDRYLLLADSYDESFVNDATSCRMFDRYAQVIGPMLDMYFGAESDASDGSRPRREIIADEISNARAASKDLALALVYLNDDEDVSKKSKEEIGKLETELDKLLRRSTDKGRVEHFGELTFGVLYRGNVNDVERWAIRIQNEVTRSGNGLSAGVSVGVAMLTERHQGPDALRSDASSALEEALETGACTILE